MSAFETGDWNCPACNDHQFARNAQCRRCGTPKPTASTNQQGAKPGDWICSACGDLQFARNAACRRCGAPKPAAAGIGDAGVAWGGKVGAGAPMGGCGCFGGAQQQALAVNMQSPMGVGMGNAYLQSQPTQTTPSNNQGIKEGDWLCASCGDHQFARNTACRACGAPKPAANGGMPAARSMGGAPVGGGFPSPAGMGGCGGIGQITTPVASNNQSVKDGDWLCQACGDHQFARNAQCRKCGSPKPAGMGGCGGMGQMAAPVAASNNQSVKDGDWQCQACGDHQFARNAQCRKCGSPKPAGAGKGGCAGGFANYGNFGAACGGGAGKGGYMAPMSQFAVGPQGVSYAAATGGKGAGGAMGGGSGAAFAPGDWLCPQCGDHQFSRNTACRKCGAGKPMTSSNNQPMKAGDWICPNPDCKDLQFAKNDACRKCGTGRPGEEGDAGRARSRSPRR